MKNTYSTAVIQPDRREHLSDGGNYRQLTLKLRRYAATRLLRSWVRIPPRAWMFVVSVVCCQVGLCDELITRPEESYRL